MSKIMVTGVSGFVGKHLVAELKARGVEVIGVGYTTPVGDEITKDLTGYFPCDLTSPGQVAKLPLKSVDAIVNLAGLANVGESFAKPERYMSTNVSVLSVLGNRLVHTGSNARVVAVSTGAIYDPHQKLPLSETSATTMDGSPYAQSKLHMEKVGQELRARGLNYVVARPFNHIGPGQMPGYLIPDLYHKIQESLKTSVPVTVGNLKTRRDYTDVRDIVKAYAALALSGTLKYDIYNICSSNSRSGQDILNLLLAELDVTDNLRIVVDRSLIRSSDPENLIGTFERIYQETGWEPQISFEQTIRDFISEA